jgi:hypothetical protein
MKSRTPFIVMSLFAMMLIALLSAFTNAPSIAQNPTPTIDPINLRATEIVAGATLTAQVGGDFTSIGTSTPLAGLCNSMSYRNLSDVEAQVKSFLLTLSPDATVDVLLLEETTDCVTFQQKMTSVTILFPIDSIETIHDEQILGNVLGTILTGLISQSSLDVLPDMTLTVSFHYGNQTRQFSMPWINGRVWGASGMRGIELLTQVTVLGLDTP